MSIGYALWTGASMMKSTAHCRTALGSHIRHLGLDDLTVALA